MATYAAMVAVQVEADSPEEAAEKYGEAIGVAEHGRDISFECEVDFEEE